MEQNDDISSKAFLYSHVLPKNVKIIDGKERERIDEVDEIVIPTYVTQLHKKCFFESKYPKIIIPTTINELPFECFFHCSFQYLICFRFAKLRNNLNNERFERIK